MRKEILQGNMSIFSRALLKELDKTIKENSQAMLLSTDGGSLPLCAAGNADTFQNAPIAK